MCRRSPQTLQGPSPPYSEIPRKVIVAKRLAQCLNPALPAGVHTRALDVYSHIFSMIGVSAVELACANSDRLRD